MANTELLDKLNEISTQIENFSEEGMYRSYSLFGVSMALAGLVAYISFDNLLYGIISLLGIFLAGYYNIKGVYVGWKRHKERKKRLEEINRLLQKTTNNIKKATKDTEGLINELKKK